MFYCLKTWQLVFAYHELKSSTTLLKGSLITMIWLFLKIIKRPKSAGGGYILSFGYQSTHSALLNLS